MKAQREPGTNEVLKRKGQSDMPAWMVVTADQTQLERLSR